MAFESKKPDQILPPLPAWPPEVFPNEPAHGYFQRLAAVNRQISAKSLATSLGINARYIVPEDFLLTVLKFPCRNKEELASSTAKPLSHLVELNGELFRTKRDWSTSRLRICPGCIYEQSYHRNWFDLAVLESCPIHGCLLVGELDGMRLAWWHPAVGVIPESGRSLAAFLPRNSPPESLERYILGRLGVLDKWPCSLLDGQRIYEIIDIAQFLGRIKTNGWSKAIPQRERFHTVRWFENNRVGFSYLKDGVEGIRKCLLEYSEGHTAEPVSGRTNCYFDRYWGWLSRATPALQRTFLTETVNQLLVDIAAEKQIFSRKHAAKMRQEAGLIGMCALAKQLGIRQRSLRKVAAKLGLADLQSRRAQAHTFDSGAVATIKTIVDDLIWRPQAAMLLGLTVRDFDKFCTENNILPFIRLNGETPAADNFLRSELMVIGRIGTHRGRTRVKAC